MNTPIRNVPTSRIRALVANGFKVVSDVARAEDLPDDVAVIYAPLVDPMDLGLQGPYGFVPAKWVADTTQIFVEGYSCATDEQRQLLCEFADRVGREKVGFVIEYPCDVEAYLAANNFR